jgi:hypothetical protein
LEAFRLLQVLAWELLAYLTMHWHAWAFDLGNCYQPE